MSTASSITELAVGIVCLVGAVPVWTRGLRVGGVLLAIAGTVGIAHAVWTLAT